MVSEQEEVLQLLESNLNSLEKEMGIYESEVVFLEKNIKHAFSVVSKQIRGATKKKNRMVTALRHFEGEIVHLKDMFSEHKLGKHIPELAKQHATDMMGRVFERTEKSLKQLKEDLEQIQAEDEISSSYFSSLFPSAVTVIACLLLLLFATMAAVFCHSVGTWITSFPAETLELQNLMPFTSFTSFIEQVMDSAEHVKLTLETFISDAKRIVLQSSLPSSATDRA